MAEIADKSRVAQRLCISITESNCRLGITADIWQIGSIDSSVITKLGMLVAKSDKNAIVAAAYDGVNSPKNRK
jgi:hypothetical protein